MKSSCRLVVTLAASALLWTPGQAQESTVVASADGVRRILVSIDGAPQEVHTSTATIEDLQLRGAPNSPALALTWTEIRANGEQAAYFALSLDGATFHPARTASYEIMLRRDEFDPLRRTPSVDAALDAAGRGRLFIVQYWTQGIEAYRDEIRALGGEPHLFLAHHANVVEMDAPAAELVRGLPFVRWVGEFHPEYKLEEELLLDQIGGRHDTYPRRLNILTTRRGPEGQAPVIERIEDLGGTVESVSPETYLLSATLELEQVAALARMDAVQWIDRWSAPEDDMDIARSFHGADYVESVGGYTGSGVRVEVLDGGCEEIHPDMQAFLVHGTNSPSNHGTCTSGIVLGSGAGNFSARGAMPDAFLVIGDYNGLSGSRYNHTNELQNPALAFKTVLQSNSWGNARTAAYTSVSQNLDLILFDHERISILQSQSNAGNQQSRPEAWAKNVIAVGGVRHFNTATKSDDSWSSGASIGPAADGRIKPDLASFYDATLCADRVGSLGYSSGNYFSSFGGTSGATPIVSGHLGLAYQMWSDGIFGNPNPGATVFDNRPYNTTAKALLINTATQWTFSGTGHDLTRVHQGWGHPDLQVMYDLRTAMLIVDESDVLTNLSTASHVVTVNAGTPMLKATLVYRDLPGTTSSSLHRINDMDLKVTSPGGTIYWGNNGLLANMTSTSGGGPNTLDTVENVFVQNPQSGAWTVEVIASEINQDSHVETGAVDADYALVVSGIVPGPPPAPVAAFVGAPLAGEAPLGVTFTDQSTGSIDTWSWTFGDGGVSSAPSPLHTYTNPGLYTVSLTVTGPGGNDTETKVDYVSVTAPQPPAAPTGLGATATSSTTIDLAWSDNSSNEDGFEIERSPDGAAWAPLTTTGPNATGFTDSGLTASTTYFYRVRAFNGTGSSAWSNTASDTTSAPGSVDQVATGEIAVSGTVTGDYVDTHVGDGSYEQIRERESGGRKSNRHSFLEHKWTFSVQGGTAITFFARAHHSASSDGDDFVFAWSTDDASYTDLFTVTKTTDDGTYQSAALPTSVSGTVYIRVKDTDQTQGNNALDTLFADHLFVRSQGTGGGTAPVAPSGLGATATSSTQIDLSWTDNSSDEDGFKVERSPDGSAWAEIAQVGANVASYSDTGLSASTTYHYRVRAFNAAGDSGYSNVAVETTPGAGTVDQVAGGEIPVAGTVTGSFVDTQANDTVYEVIQERESGGKKSTRTSFLEHKWTFSVQSGSAVTFFAKAHHSPSSDGDDFVLAYSTDDVAYTDMLTVTKTSDDGTYQSFALPPSLSGTVYVRALDTDRTQGNRSLDSLFVDHLFIRTQ